MKTKTRLSNRMPASSQGAHRIRIACVLFAGLAAFGIAHAGLLDALTDAFATKVTVSIQHPPGTKMTMKLTAVALGAPEGQCADPVSGLVEEDFVAAGVTVIDRAHLDSVLKELKLQSSALIDGATATKVGKMLGAQALIFVKTTSCNNTVGQKQIGKDKYNNPVIAFITQGNIHGSLRVIDLTTGKVLSAQHLDATGQLQAQGGYPSGEEAMVEAEKSAATMVHKMFFPWTETKEVVVYSDSDCSLKEAVNLLKGQQVDAALERVSGSLDDCRTKNTEKKPKVVAHALYDMGVLQLMKSDYDSAIGSFTEANKLATSDSIVAGLAEAKRAKDLQAQVDAGGSAFGPSGSAPAGNAPGAKPTPAAAGASPAADGGSAEERLKKLDGLLKKGLITKDEYAAKRKEILSSM